jgi:O-antigen ligase
MLYAGIGSPLVLFVSPKTQLRIAVVISCFVLVYPLLRSLELFPVELMTQISESAGAERSESLTFRLVNEEKLLEQVRERPLLGWGGYGRGRIYDEEGRDVSVTDGLWIIFLGRLGAVGFLGLFGLGLLPVFETVRALRNVPSPSDRALLASVALLISVGWADSLPNALSGGILMVFMNGALSGVVAASHVRRPVGRLAEASSPTAALPLGPSSIR